MNVRKIENTLGQTAPESLKESSRLLRYPPENRHEAKIIVDHRQNPQVPFKIRSRHTDYLQDPLKVS